MLASAEPMVLTDTMDKVAGAGADPTAVPAVPPNRSSLNAEDAVLPRRKVTASRKGRPREVTAEEAEEFGISAELGARAMRQVTRLTNYADMDAGVEGGSVDESQAKVRRKKQKLMSDSDSIEAQVAFTLGFPPDSLMEEEIEAGLVSTLGGVEQASYVAVRNYILSVWRNNVNQWLTIDRIMERIRSQHRALAESAYKFLVSRGYINFGVAPAIRAAIPQDLSKASVIIVGAGLSGLAAARQLLAFGHKVVVVEGRQRAGGRVYTKTMERDNFCAAADLGGSVITGINGNPLGVIARQLGFRLHKIRDVCPLFTHEGHPVSAELDKKVEEEFNWVLEQASNWRKEMDHVADEVSLGTTLETLRERAGIASSPEERQLLDWHMANLEYANAALLSDLSLANWDQDDPYEMSGDHCFLEGGNVRLVNALAEGLPISYGLTVKEIKYGPQGVRVTALKPGPAGEAGQEQVFEGDMVLCTVSLGVLKRKDSIRFDPPLPQRKQEAIDRLGFGLLNKVAMLFPEPFWGDDLDTFGRLATNPEKRGEFFLFYSYYPVAGGALLLGLVAGEAAHRFEEMKPEETVERVMAVLRGIYSKQGVVVPYPMITQCTRWKSDPLAGGSYSYVKVGASGDDYDILAADVNGRLFFAGEATTRRHPATMHGAFLSGLREAGKIAEVAAERAEPLSRRTAQQRMGPLLCAAALKEIFEEPDVEFGAFAAVHDPRSASPEAPCLLRVNILRESERQGQRGNAGHHGHGMQKGSELPGQAASLKLPEGSRSLGASSHALQQPAQPPRGMFLGSGRRSMMSLLQMQEKKASQVRLGASGQGSDYGGSLGGQSVRVGGSQTGASQATATAHPVRHWKKQEQGASQEALQLYAIVSRTEVEQLTEVKGGDLQRIFFLSEQLGVKLVGRRGLGMECDELVAAIKWARVSKRKTQQKLNMKSLLPPPKPGKAAGSVGKGRKDLVKGAAGKGGEAGPLRPQTANAAISTTALTATKWAAKGVRAGREKGLVMQNWSTGSAWEPNSYMQRMNPPFEQLQEGRASVSQQNVSNERDRPHVIQL